MKNLFQEILSFLLFLLYLVYRLSWKTKIIPYDSSAEGRAALPSSSSSLPHIYAHWHGDELLLVGLYCYHNLSVMVSHSKDGQWMSKVLRWLGYQVVRGSSSRGGALGLMGLIRKVQDGFPASLAVDGPRGPVGVVKLGVLKLAQQTGCPVIPGAAASSRKYVLKKTWNQCFLPLPFSWCVVLQGIPFFVPKDISEQELEEMRLKLEFQLHELKSKVEILAENLYTKGRRRKKEKQENQTGCSAVG